MNRDLIRAAFTGENLIGFGLFIAGLICRPCCGVLRHILEYARL